MVAPRLRPIATIQDHTGTSPPPATAATEEGTGSSRERLIGQSLTTRYSDCILEALDELPDNFLITDPVISGHPIVFASRGFLAMSGYAREEVVGRNGSIFQGPSTDRRSVMEIREAIREEQTLQISLLNYRKDGTPHWILFHLFPVFAMEDGRVIHFIAVQVPIPRRSKCSRSGAREMVLRACRNEVRFDEDCGCNLAVDSFLDMDNRGLDAEESCKASDREKEGALNAANSILSTLTRYSKLTGRVVCAKRCCSAGIPPLSSFLNISLGRIKQSFVLTDPHLPGMPIVYASDEFLSLTGYSRHEALGCNCRFLNGPGTDAGVLQQIEDCIRVEQDCSVRLLNYRKDGSSFWNLLHMSPVRDASGKIAFYVEVQMDENSKSDEHRLSPRMRQLGVVGQVKVAARSLSSRAGPSRTSS